MRAVPKVVNSSSMSSRPICVSVLSGRYLVRLSLTSTQPDEKMQNTAAAMYMRKMMFRLSTMNAATRSMRLDFSDLIGIISPEKCAEFYKYRL